MRRAIATPYGRQTDGLRRTALNLCAAICGALAIVGGGLAGTSPVRAETDTIHDMGVIGAQSGNGAKQLRSFPGVVALGKFRVPIVDAGRLDGDLALVLAVTPKNIEEIEALKADQFLVRATVFPAVVDFAQVYASPRLAVDVGRLVQMLDQRVRAEHPNVDRVLVLEVRAYRAREAEL